MLLCLVEFLDFITHVAWYGWSYAQLKDCCLNNSTLGMSLKDVNMTSNKCWTPTAILYSFSQYSFITACWLYLQHYCMSGCRSLCHVLILTWSMWVITGARLAKRGKSLKSEGMKQVINFAHHLARRSTFSIAKRVLFTYWTIFIMAFQLFTQF